MTYEQLLTLVQPLFNAVWLALPAAVTSLFSHWIRPRFTGLGSRHRTASGNRYRFGIHYIDDVELNQKIKIELQLRGDGKTTSVPVLLAGPENGVCAATPNEVGNRFYEFELKSARPRSAWVLTCETDGKEANAEVSIGAPRMAPIQARAVQPHSRHVQKEASARDLAWLLGVMLAAAAMYAAPIVYPESWKSAPLSAELKEDLFEARLPLVEELIPGMLCFLGILGMYYVCMSRERLPLSQGYLGWEKEDDGKKDPGGKP